MPRAKDTFFSQDRCDRCPNDLRVRILSWFNSQTICMECSKKETAIKDELTKQGKDPRDFEGCGYIPILEEI
jgi:hypothetical protein